MKRERSSEPKIDPMSKAVDDWWKNTREKGLLSKAIDNSSERYPLANVELARPVPTEERRHEPRNWVFSRRPGTLVTGAAFAALGLSTVGFLLSWSWAQAQDQEVFSSAVEQSVSFLGPKNAWKDEMENSLMGAFFLPSSKP